MQDNYGKFARQKELGMPDNLFRKLGRHAVSLPAVAAHHVMNLEVIESRLFTAHLEAQAVHRQKLPILSGIEKDAAASLETEGIFMTSLEQLQVEKTDAMFAAGIGLAFGTRRISRPSPLSEPDSRHYKSLVQWALSPPLIRIAESYLGLPVAYDGPKVAYTPADGRQAGTRLWHRDREDRRMMKIAIYLHEVTEDGGPLQAIKREIFEGSTDRDFRYPILSHEDLEKQLRRKIADGDITSCTGPAGTVIFMDTARLFHRGKPAVAQSRHVVFHSYFARTPRHPFFCERSDLSRSQLGSFAQELPPDQRSSILWYQHLPRFLKAVPKSIV